MGIASINGSDVVQGFMVGLLVMILLIVLVDRRK